MPRWRHIARSQRSIRRALAGGRRRDQFGGLFGWRGVLIELGGDEFVDGAGASLGLMAKRDRNLATNLSLIHI